ncbi:MAG: class I SAM-dependent methyltransferase, partial [Thermoplasmata archaeon]
PEMRHPRSVNRLVRIANGVLGAKVRKGEAEHVRKELASAGLVDKSHAIVEDGEFVIIPLLSPPPASSLRNVGAEVVDHQFPQRTFRTDPIDDIRRIADVPEDLRSLLPSKWELFGEVLVIRLDPALDRYEHAIAGAYASVLGAKTVLRDVGGITGEHRRPVIRKLLGTDAVALHKENGIVYKFDAAEIMFSSGNMEERMRMAELECDDEVIVDMFAGIGYFSLPLAVYQRPAHIVACEINSVAHSYLVENIRLNRVAKIVEPVHGDNRDLKGEGIADRIIMGYLKTTHEHLPCALRLLKSGGIIHYHETCPNELLPNRPIQRLMDSAKGCEVKVLRSKEIKSYAPGVSHVVVDARIVKPS